MSQTLSLNGLWSLFWHDDFPQYLTALDVPMRASVVAQVPEPVHATLLRDGLIPDPRFGLNSLAGRWIEEQFFVYRRVFVTPETCDSNDFAWIVFDLLELDAIVWLNGHEIGRHNSAHVPARFRVESVLRPAGEENVLVVRVDAGLYNVAEKPAADYRATPLASLSKIHWMRRGQWQRGWDWQQRLLNVGILGDVRVEINHRPVATQCQVIATVSDNLSMATVTAKLIVENPFPEPRRVTLHLRVCRPFTDPERAGEPAPDATIDDGGLWLIGNEFSPEFEVDVPPGRSVQVITETIPNPRLWWPIGHGEPTLYTAMVVFSTGIGPHDSQVFAPKFGVRKVEVDQSPHPEVGRHFILKVNDKPIFCKGGNWVPPDMLHSTVTRERLTELVDLAVGANFNLLRIWGGGTWAGHDLLELCDENGLLVWHDLLFACSKYPGDFPEFAAQARDEVAWGLREFSQHPSVVVWCGNNEIEEGDWEWGYDRHYRTHPHYALFHRDFPRIAKAEAPHIFYWISSPFSPDYADPTDPTVGDQHPWGVSLRQDGPTDWWAYRDYVDRFPNEGGVLGASSPATLKQFLPENQRRINSLAWDHHDNPFAMQPVTPGQRGRIYQTITLWTGHDPARMELDDYVILSGLLQAEGLTEYIVNYRRRMFSSSAAIFWMYNDSWPTTHGWSIVDYYGRKKLAYHPVRRAFQPVSVICGAHETGVCYYVVNETGQKQILRAFTGTFATDGSGRGVIEEDDPFLCEMGPAEVFEINNGWQRSYFQVVQHSGAFATLTDANGILVAQHRAFFSRFHELGLIPDPEIETRLENGILTLQSRAFVWGVCLDIDGERPVADNAFDLLPGIPYSLPWDESVLGPPRILATGNSLLERFPIPNT